MNWYNRQCNGINDQGTHWASASARCTKLRVAGL